MHILTHNHTQQWTAQTCQESPAGRCHQLHSGHFCVQSRAVAAGFGIAPGPRDDRVPEQLIGASFVV